VAAALIAGALLLGKTIHDHYFSKPTQVCVEYKPGSFGIYNSCARYETR
jgi:hypothetical protein